MVLAAVLLTAVGILGIAGLGDRTPGGVPTVAPAPGGEDEQGLPDPFAWDPEREDEFVRRAATGTSHLLYTLSPGGAAESAKRVDRWRPQIEAAARAAGVNPDTLEGLVFLESAGRDDAVTPNGIEGAVGLTQILAGTATDLLDMKVDTRAQRAARAAGSTASSPAATPARWRGCAASGPRSTSASTAPRRSPPPAATSSSRTTRSAARTSRSSPTTWASATCRGCCARSARTRAGPRSTSTRPSPATPTPTAACSSSATTPRTTTGRCSRGARSCACTATTARSSSG